MKITIDVEQKLFWAVIGLPADDLTSQKVVWRFSPRMVLAVDEGDAEAKVRKLLPAISDELLRQIQRQDPEREEWFDLILTETEEEEVPGIFRFPNR